MERKIKLETILEKNGVSMELKCIDAFGKFCGYASVFNIKDSYQDIILPSAFKNSLNSKNIRKDIKLLWQHEHNKPIGYFNIIKEDSVGLYVEGQILLDIRQGMEAYRLIQNKSVSGLSIGYVVKKAENDSRNGVRLIKEVDLFEISIVTFPANQYSNITYCKSKSLEETIIEKLNMLRDYLEEK